MNGIDKKVRDGLERVPALLHIIRGFNKDLQYSSEKNTRVPKSFRSYNT
jgi:hypothetical protein